MALPYLPHEQIPAAFDALRGQLREDQPKLQAFMAYVERQWIKPRIAYNVFNMDRKVVFIAKLPLILGGFFELG